MLLTKHKKHLTYSVVFIIAVIILYSISEYYHNYCEIKREVKTMMCKNYMLIRWRKKINWCPFKTNQLLLRQIFY